MSGNGPTQVMRPTPPNPAAEAAEAAAASQGRVENPGLHPDHDSAFRLMSSKWNFSGGRGAISSLVNAAGKAMKALKQIVDHPERYDDKVVKAANQKFDEMQKRSQLRAHSTWYGMIGKALTNRNMVGALIGTFILLILQMLDARKARSVADELERLMKDGAKIKDLPKESLPEGVDVVGDDFHLQNPDGSVDVVSSLDGARQRATDLENAADGTAQAYEDLQRQVQGVSVDDQESQFGAHLSTPEGQAQVDVLNALDPLVHPPVMDPTNPPATVAGLRVSQDPQAAHALHDETGAQSASSYINLEL